MKQSTETQAERMPKRKPVLLAAYDTWQGQRADGGDWRRRDTVRYVWLYLFGRFRRGDGASMRSSSLLSRLASVATRLCTASLKPSHFTSSSMRTKSTEREESVENETG